MYVLYNQKYYLMQNAIKQFVPTPELNEAFQFNDKIKAENALANLPKQMRNLGYFVQQIDAPSKPVDFDQFNAELELVNYDSALAQIGSFCDLHDQLVARATWVEYKLQEVENKIQDVLHAIEFNSYNARDGYKIYITAHMYYDCNMYIHPTQARGLTPREAARVQGFPDDYLFLGSPNEWYRQIGNAVSPLMARVLGNGLKKVLERIEQT